MKDRDVSCPVKRKEYEKNMTQALYQKKRPVLRRGGLRTTSYYTESIESEPIDYIDDYGLYKVPTTAGWKTAYA
ncbi:MAG: hypothetical protein Q8O19_00605 [Rectinemataceae bacterium]|nr:hypothetical protein [Rectinemataceae bacterium]